MSDFICGRCGVLNKDDGTSGCICGKFRRAIEDIYSPWFIPLCFAAIMIGGLISLSNLFGGKK